MTDADLAAAVAEAAGRLLLDLRSGGLLEGRALADAGDRLAGDYIVAALRAQRPGDGILSEEHADTAERLEKRRVWIVDPLDGTREYAEGRDDWAVHVALAIDGAPAAAAVALPAEGKLLRSDRPPPVPACGEKLRMLVSRTRPPALAEEVAAALGAELVPMGSAGAKAMAVLLGRGDLYLHSGGQYEWDNCAPAAVALGCGLVATRLDGSALAYNNADPTLPDLIIAHPDVAARVRAILDR